MSARVVVLVSGAGSTMAALVDAAAGPAFGAHVVAVGSDRESAHGLERAREAGVATFTVPFRGFTDRARWDAALAERIADYAPDLVVSAGFMRLLGPHMLRRHHVVNVHPALLPAFPGAHAVRDALAYGVRIAGATVHFVDEGVDTGPVVAQAAVEVRPDDDVSSLHARIQEVERRLLVDAVRRLVSEGWTLEGRQVRLGSGAPGPTAGLGTLAEENR